MEHIALLVKLLDQGSVSLHTTSFDAPTFTNILRAFIQDPAALRRFPVHIETLLIDAEAHFLCLIIDSYLGSLSLAITSSDLLADLQTKEKFNGIVIGLLKLLHDHFLAQSKETLQRSQSAPNRGAFFREEFRNLLFSVDGLVAAAVDAAVIQENFAVYLARRAPPQSALGRRLTKRFRKRKPLVDRTTFTRSREHLISNPDRGGAHARILELGIIEEMLFSNKLLSRNDIMDITLVNFYYPESLILTLDERLIQRCRDMDSDYGLQMASFRESVLAGDSA